MTPEAQVALRTAGDRAGMNKRTQARKEVIDAVDAMKKRGLVVHTPDAAEMKEWHALAEALYPRIRGSMVPADTFDEVFKHVKAYRALTAK